MFTEDFERISYSWCSGTHFRIFSSSLRRTYVLMLIYVRANAGATFIDFSFVYTGIGSVPYVLSCSPEVVSCLSVTMGNSCLIAFSVI